MTPRARLLLAAAGGVAVLLLGARFAARSGDGAPDAMEPVRASEVETSATDTRLADAAPAVAPERDARVEAALRSVDDSASTGAATPAEPPAVVHVRTVLWTGALPGTPVADVAVECTGRSLPDRMWLELGRTDARGRLEVPLFEPGAYRFGVDEASVPEGLLPPGDLAETPLPHAPGIVLPSVEAAAGETAEVTLWLMEARSLRGRVVDASGAPAHGARVALTGLDSCLRRGERTRRASLDEHGAFVFEGLYPLEYELHLSGWSVGGTTPPTWVGEHIQPGDEFGPRAGLYVDLRERSLAGVELNVAPGDFAISGRLVDDDGLPVEGRRVRAQSTHLANGAPDARDHLAAYERVGFLASARTDALGRFELEGIVRRPLRIVVEPTEVPRLGNGTWTFGERTTLFSCDPSTDPEDSFDVGDVVVPTVALYRATGRVEVDPSRPGGAAVVLSELQLDLRYEPDEDLHAMTPSLRPRREYDPRTGAFQYVCPTPRAVATLWLYPSGESGRGKRFQLYPKAGVVEDGIVLSYPVKTHVLLLVALVLGAVLLLRLAFDAESGEFAALEPHDASEQVEAAERGPRAQGELATPSARAPRSGSSARTPEEPIDATPAGEPAADAEPEVLDLLVVHARPDQADVPLPGVRVFVVDDASEPIGSRALLGTTGGDGHLVTEMPASGLPGLLADPATLPVGVGSVGELEVPRHARAGRVVFGARGSVEPAPEPDGPVERTLKLPSAGALVVTARAADGAPVQGAFVEIWRRTESERHPPRWSRILRVGRTDEEGVAVLENLHAGELLVELDARRSSAGARGVPEGASPPQRVRLVPAGREQLTFELGSGRHVLRGRVADDAGMPVEGVAIDARYDRRAPGASLPRSAHALQPPARAATTTTDEAGRFELEGLGEGPYLLFFDMGPAMARTDERGLLPAPIVVREVQTGADATLLHALDDVVVPRVELFVVKGRVVLDEGLLGEDELTLRDLRPRIGGGLGVHLARCDYDARSGAFAVVCRLPLEQLTIELMPRRRVPAPSPRRFGPRPAAPEPAVEGAPPREFLFTPEAGLVLEDVELRYP